MFSSNTSQVSDDAVFVESVFSTYLYTGNGSTQTITNGIDLAGEGGLVWLKSRTSAVHNHQLTDTVRGAGYILQSNTTNAQSLASNIVSGFNASGFNLGNGVSTNTSGDNYASWTFRKAQKFFDVLTYTGNGIDPRAISHNLGSVPGMIVVKRTNSSGSDWLVYHRSLATGQLLSLNGTSAAYTTNEFTTTAPTSSVFYVANSDAINGSGNTYVAYLFAHDAGGFGQSGSDNVVSCGSYTGNGSTTGPTVTLGYEPQWLLVKNATSVRNWFLVDNMRGLTVGGVDPILQPNSSSAEQSSSSYNYFSPTATGFSIVTSDADVNGNGSTYIYIAIRRPMKPPESGTSVYQASFVTNTTPAFTSSFPIDLAIVNRVATTDKWYFDDRLRGANTLNSATTGAEAGQSIATYDYMTGFGSNGWYVATNPYLSYLLRRAPGFFDVVCYTGTGSARTVAHNLTVAPELMIVKCRSTARAWPVYAAPIGNTNELRLNETGGSGSTSVWNSTTPTSSVFSLGTPSLGNFSGDTYVAYLFATLAGISKVGSYTGTGTTQQINCGFTGGARFVLIKRTDSTGDWYVWDSARGIVAGNDPYLLLNSTAAEVTSTDYIDTYSAGFEISSTAPAAINASGGSFIFFAVS